MTVKILNLLFSHKCTYSSGTPLTVQPLEMLMGESVIRFSLSCATMVLSSAIQSLQSVFYKGKEWMEYNFFLFYRKIERLVTLGQEIFILIKTSEPPDSSSLKVSF